MSDHNTVMQPARAGLVHRALGKLIVVTAALPLVLVMVLGVWKTVAGLRRRWSQYANLCWVRLARCG
ncbi:MAG TPA: hypothetical protein PLQ67_07910 [Burkholderiaceae bacterium]|nr:hypothetical protein [Burkholderiaceae bacterium]